MFLGVTPFYKENTKYFTKGALTIQVIEIISITPKGEGGVIDQFFVKIPISLVVKTPPKKFRPRSAAKNISISPKEEGGELSKYFYTYRNKHNISISPKGEGAVIEIISIT